jgi:hypothetical protein
MRITTHPRSRTTGSPTQQPAARLRLEPLEDRAVPDFGFGWAFNIGSTGYEDGAGIATDDQGNVYVSGQFSGTVDFDPSAGRVNLTSAGSSDAFAAKYSPAGGGAGLGGGPGRVGPGFRGRGPGRRRLRRHRD